MLFVVCVCVFVLFVWVMVVGVGVSWWCVFQWCVAVVAASSVVPGVLVCVGWLVVGACGVCGCVVGACSGVGWLVCVLWWFRMLTCSGLFSCFLVLSFVWLITVGVPGGGFCGGSGWWWGWCWFGGVFACVCSCAREWHGGGVGLCG